MGEEKPEKLSCSDCENWSNDGVVFEHGDYTIKVGHCDAVYRWPHHAGVFPHGDVLLCTDWKPKVEQKSPSLYKEGTE